MRVRICTLHEKFVCAYRMANDISSITFVVFTCFSSTTSVYLFRHRIFYLIYRLRKNQVGFEPTIYDLQSYSLNQTWILIQNKKDALIKKLKHLFFIQETLIWLLVFNNKLINIFCCFVSFTIRHIHH